MKILLVKTNLGKLKFYLIVLFIIGFFIYNNREVLLYVLNKRRIHVALCVYVHFEKAISISLYVQRCACLDT